MPSEFKLIANTSVIHSDIVIVSLMNFEFSILCLFQLSALILLSEEKCTLTEQNSEVIPCGKLYSRKRKCERHFK